MEKLLNPDEMAAMLGVRTSTIYQWTHRKFIPFVKIGKLIRFRQSDVKDWLDKKSSSGRPTRKLPVTDLGIFRSGHRK
ncbi:MAG: helix-turn-helix domain-containing protein [candidate division Zixibacteria bacterium]|nr:helix-turn-helix domain-containing protein [candidate division Zixibacteria bacterium]